jgi:serine/threonine protein kinase
MAITNVTDAVMKQCPGLSAGLREMHFRRMPESYHERYSPADIARHLRLILRLSNAQPIEVEVKSLGGRNLEICVVGHDRAGVLAAITTAMASDSCDIQDLQLATYLPPDEDLGKEKEPTYFVDVMRVAVNRRYNSAAEMSAALRDRLCRAFRLLEEGDLVGAQTAASDSHSKDGPSKNNSRPSCEGVVVKEGLVLDGFRLEEKLASGGMSEVYLATQVSLDRKVAVKLVSGDALDTIGAAARFAKETQVLAEFSCPFIVPVLASGTKVLATGVPLRWMAMEYLSNGDLAVWIKRHGTPPVNVVIRWFHQALQGLEYAHKHAILHRDLKPHNLLLTADGDVKITDFGLLKHTGQIDPNLTTDGAVLGTPQYISPEQALAEEADERADIYSLGATFYQMVSGKLSFEDKNTTSLLLKITQHQPPGLLKVAPAAPRPLAVIIDRMMALRREDRYQNVHVIIEDLRSYVQSGLLEASEESLSRTEQTKKRLPAETPQAFQTTHARAEERHSPSGKATSESCYSSQRVG